MIRIYRSLRFTSFSVLIAVNDNIDLILVIANTFFDTINLIQHSSTSSSNKRQKTDIINNFFFHVIDDQASNVIIKNVYETENVNHDTKKIHECQKMHDKLCILEENNDPNHGTRLAHNVERRYKLASEFK